MKNALLVLFILCEQFIFAAKDTQIWTNTYGKKENPAIIFVHGGPGYNSANFEFSTAQVLADKGYYVVVFDQRGCGRSKEMEGKYTMDEAINDLKFVYKKNELKTATLIGHSWGGTLAAKFTEKNPKMVTRLIWTGSPLSYQMTFRNILSRCKIIYTEKKDSVNLNYISYLEKMDTTTLAYSSYLFSHAMLCGLYQPSEISEKSKEIYKSLRGNENSKLLMQMESNPVQGFHKNEKYTCLDLTKTINALKKKKIPVHGIYGKDDGLFDEKQLDLIKSLLATENLIIVEKASHNVFIDQQEIFINSVVGAMK